MLKKKKKVIIISTVVIIVLCLVLFIPFPTTKDCARCLNGVAECGDKRAAEYLSGTPQPNHDCNLCTYGVAICRQCDGLGELNINKSLFEKLLDAI